MKKKLVSLLLTLAMACALLPAASAAAVGSLPARWAAPTNVTVTDDTNYGGSGPFMLRASYSVGDDHSGFADAVANENWSAIGCTDAVYYDTTLQIDWRINGGGWHYDDIWDERDENRTGADEWLFYRVGGPYGSDRANDAVFMYLPDEYGWNEYGWAAEFAAQGVSDVRPNADGNMILDLTKHKLEIRIRLATLVTGADVDAAYNEEGYQGHIILSPWSAVAAIGAGAGPGAVKPAAIPKPAVSGFNVAAAKNDGTVDDGYPIFKFTLAVPDEVSKIAADATALYTDLGIEAQVNVSGGGWQDIRIGSASWAEVTSGVHTGYMPGISAGDVTKVLGGASQFRARYHWFDGDLYSPWSEVLTFNSSAWTASGWAQDYVQKAGELGLIPDSLKQADLTRPINRQEFAAVCVKVYENLGNTAALPAVNNPFTDCGDVEVLKAYNAGITSGTSATTFSPDKLLNRQEAATMLTAVYKRVTVAGWQAGVDYNHLLGYESHMAASPFADHAQIDAWARPSVYFMAMHGVVSGVGENRFAPKNTTTAQEAAGYANATREQALTIAVAMVEKLG